MVAQGTIEKASPCYPIGLAEGHALARTLRPGRIVEENLVIMVFMGWGVGQWIG